VNILSLDLDDVLIAGNILAFLQKTGQPIGIEDVLIASTALNRQCTLVSGNTRYFTKIVGLALENWLDPL
jgi:tRNA(fMet)-specific endonuclease VapC